ncbi:DivIVA domain-containing protein [Aetokthonos hydrillicola Thurmond2011]|jgi:cell division septum initiation protein DivIVA|uniref:DivIVA domain-containing protein n=1 Tax=Aetokthonos hydrillicola Thurmond2011 TaxID=2712845 RepID=A0AAP5M7P6_9CYAN|nr:DivIVA domain-containing protein [Aetokthonos hydrillicola]MBW4584778.1 DivIVA domain-containing protein [Aetokthonos hydrillicola CCALA 1050]MDR9895325.1 DivIVA domain-containing protein [Aetokthonos hydrillicola Thurmond2011]
MLRSEQSGVQPNQNGSHLTPEEFTEESESLDIQQELNRIEEMILASPRIPFTRRTLVDEEKLLDQLDYVRLSLPTAFQEAAEIITQKEEILLEAEEYGQQILDAAQAKRAEILDESDIIRQAEQEAAEIRQKAQQEYDSMLQATLEEIDLKRRQCQQELDQMHSKAIAQAEAIEQGADQYADNVLQNIEQHLNDMLRIIRNGRQQLHSDVSLQRNPPPPKKK